MEFKLLLAILALGLLWGLILKFVMSNLMNTATKMKSAYDMTKLYKQKEAEVAKMKANGDFHEWVTIQGEKEAIMVCKKTGWSPELKGFIPMHIISGYLEKKRQEEEYKTFRNARVLRLALEFGISINHMDELVEKVFSIKKDFTLIKLTELQESLEKRASDVSKQG